MWSSFLAQSTMLDRVYALGISPEQLIAEEGLHTNAHDVAFSVATDDVFSFERAGIDEDLSDSLPPLAAFDRALQDGSIRSNAGKARDRVRDCTCLGIELRDGMWLGLREKRLKDLITCMSSLIVGEPITPRQLQGLIGTLTWQNLLARPLFSCLHCSYGFVHSGDLDRGQPLTVRVFDEILLNMCLMPYWIVDLTRQWSPTVSMTDASQAHGYGMAWVSLPLEVVSNLANEVAHWPHHVKLLSPVEAGAGEPRLRAGQLTTLPVRLEDFQAIFSIKARRAAPPGVLEARAAHLGILRVLRNRRSHRSRAVFGIDAQAVLHALRKGRSSSGGHRRLIAACGAALLAGDLRAKFFYVPTEYNAADPPSRGKQTRIVRTIRKATNTRGNTELIHLARLRRALGRAGLLSDSSDFSDEWSHAALKEWHH
jgi:hypothetical protein